MPTTRTNLTRDRFLKSLINDVPLLDVRAPKEFAKGAFPTSYNVAILDDEQRHLVGTEYAENGQDSAIELGLVLAKPDVRQSRIESWQDFATANPRGYLYCFRGGLRSQTTQDWLAQAGCKYPLVEGGYKALRGFLIDQLVRLCDKGNIILVSGMTGVGKTNFIQSQSSAIDIEGRALHRGSAFGKLFTEQPSQINWENQVIIDWLKCDAAGKAPVLIEAESHQIGKVHVPQVLQNAMASAPRVTLTAPLAERVERLYQDYVLKQFDHFKITESEPWGAIQQQLSENLGRIRKRLGGARYQELCKMLPNAIKLRREKRDSSGLNKLITLLLRDYYDPQYQYHNDKNQVQSVFTGNAESLKKWLST